MTRTLTTERQQFAEQNEMITEFVNWFFDEKKEGCGNAWFIMASAMWEGWKGRANREAQPVTAGKFAGWGLYHTKSGEFGNWLKSTQESDNSHAISQGYANVKLYTAPPAPAVPVEMTGGIAMSKYKVKKSNYSQWVKGWNACRAAMLAAAPEGGN
jgi:hypothetical protein